MTHLREKVKLSDEKLNSNQDTWIVYKTVIIQIRSKLLAMNEKFY